MDWYPLYNSIRVALLAATAAFFLGVFAAHRTGRLSCVPRSVLDAVLSLPLVLPPTVSGWLLLRVLGPRRLIGFWLQAFFNLRLVLTWQAAVLPAFLAAFPVMYRVARRAFDAFDEDLSDAALTLGRSGAWTFWMIKLPACRRALLAGGLLSLVRAAGEFGATAMAAGYTPGRTATASTEIYYLWRGGDNTGALVWVLVNLLISSGFLLAVSLLENGYRPGNGYDDEEESHSDPSGHAAPRGRDMGDEYGEDDYFQAPRL